MITETPFELLSQTYYERFGRRFVYINHSSKDAILEPNYELLADVVFLCLQERRGFEQVDEKWLRERLSTAGYTKVEIDSLWGE